jgi:hypothetical protein
MPRGQATVTITDALVANARARAIAAVQVTCDPFAEFSTGDQFSAAIDVTVTPIATARARLVVNLGAPTVACDASTALDVTGVLATTTCAVEATFRIITAGSGTGDEERRRKDREEAEALSRQQQVPVVPPRPGPFIITPIMGAPTDPNEDDAPFGYFFKDS